MPGHEDGSENYDVLICSRSVVEFEGLRPFGESGQESR